MYQANKNCEKLVNSTMLIYLNKLKKSDYSLIII